MGLERVEGTDSPGILAPGEARGSIMDADREGEGGLGPEPVEGCWIAGLLDGSIAGELNRMALEAATTESKVAKTGFHAAAESKPCLAFVYALAAGMIWVVEDATLALAYVLMPIALAAGVCSLWVAWSSTDARSPLRAGRRALGLQIGLVPIVFLRCGGDWVHSFWSVQFPMTGLLLGSGLLLVRGGRGSSGVEAPRWPRTRPMATAGGVLLALAAMPGLLAWSSFGGGTGSGEVSTITTLVESALHGFGGDLPRAMVPLGGLESERGLGVPPRIVTVTMGASFLAAIHWTLFVGVALLGAAIRNGGARRSVAPVIPVALSVALFPLAGGQALFQGIWRNEAWFLGAYGPILAVALVSTLVMVLGIRRASESPH